MGVSYLLDTHAIIWLAGRRRPVRPEVLDAVNDQGAAVFASAASAFESATKVRLGKLPEAGALVEDWPAALRELGATELVVTSAHALVAGASGWAHRDPFDRLLVAQAQVEGLTLVTADRALLDAPGIDVLPW